MGSLPLYGGYFARSYLVSTSAEAKAKQNEREYYEHRGVPPPKKSLFGKGVPVMNWYYLRRSARRAFRRNYVFGVSIAYFSSSAKSALKTLKPALKA